MREEMAEFIHEEMYLIWLREADPKEFRSPLSPKDHITKECNKYIPTINTAGHDVCYYGLSKSLQATTCELCSDQISKMIHTLWPIVSIYRDLKQLCKL